MTRPSLASANGDIAPALKRLLEMMRANHRVQGEATMESLRRFLWLAPFLVPLHLGLSWWLSLREATTSQVDARLWAASLASIHLVAGGFVLVMALVVKRILRRDDRASLGAIVLHILVASVYLIIAIAVSSVGIATGTGAASTFLLACVIMAVLSLMRPALSMPMFSAALLAFWKVLQVMHRSDAQLDSLRINALAACILSMVVSIMIWHNYAKTVMLRRELAQRNADLEAKQVELLHLAERDSLTGLYNRREFMRRAEEALAGAMRQSADLHLIMIDIDHFKQVNDIYGHPAGDHVLCETAALLMLGVRISDTVARLGGEEFVVLLPHTKLADALALAEKAREELSGKLILYGGQPIPVTASFGVSGLARGQVGTTVQLLGAADRALYRAKRSGRNRVESEPVDCTLISPTQMRAR